MPTLVVASHSFPQRSVANRRLLEAIGDLEDVAVHALELRYPDGCIDVAAEQVAAEAAERIVFQFSMNWYSTPPSLKRWMDDVLAVGWAYGPGGTRLRGKRLQVVATCGASAESYRPDGYNRYPIKQLLTPLRATAEFVGMTYDVPLVLYDVPNVPGLPLPPADTGRVDTFARRYRDLLLRPPRAAPTRRRNL